MSQGRFPWRTLLFVSLALNVLIVGVVIGAAGAGVRLQRAGAIEAPMRAGGLRAFMRALGPESRAAFREDLARVWLDSRQLRARSRAARRTLFETASEEPYDAEHVRAAFAAMREADQETLAAFHDAVSAALGQLEAEERRRVLAELAERQRAPARRRLMEQEQEDAEGR